MPSPIVSLPHIEAVVFDLDGTLVDTLDDITSTLNLGLAAVGAEPAAKDDIRHWVGDGLAELVERALPSASAEARRRVCARAEKARRAAPVRTARPYEGMREVVEALRSRGLGLAVLTNKEQRHADLVTEHSFPAGTFSIVRGLVEEESRKPDPGGAHEVLEHLGVAPEKSVLVGDTEVDLRTARNAGVWAVAVAWGFRDRPELERLAPDALVDAPGELLPLLGVQAPGA